MSLFSKNLQFQKQDSQVASFGTFYPPGGGELPYMGYIGMCRSEAHGFQAVYSRIGYINQSVWV